MTKNTAAAESDIMELTLRAMNFDDIEQVLEIEEKSFNTPWSREAFVAEMDANHCAFYIVAEHGGRVIAYGGMWCILDEGHITNIATHPDYRGRGIGTVVVDTMLKEGHKRGIKTFTLEVRVSNYNAIKLYEKMGFKNIGVRKGYYQDTKEDAIIMWAGDRE